MNIVTAYFSLSLLGLVIVVTRPSGPFVLVVTPPSLEAAGNMAVLEKADAALVSVGSVAWMSVAYSDTADFPQRLLDAGALLVINHNLALGCLQGSNT